MSLLLEKVILAAENSDWSSATAYLRQLIQQETKSTPEIEQILDLALIILESSDFAERWHLAQIIPQLGIVAIQPLITILEDKERDLEQRWFAGRILGEFAEPQVIASLVKILETSEDEDLSEIAAHALTNLGTSAIDVLSQLLKQPESKLLATRSLAQIRSPEVIEPLLSMAQDQDATIRATVIQALSNFRDSRITSVILGALTDYDSTVRKEAVIALGYRSELLEELDLCHYLAPLLYDVNLEVCQHSAIALSKIKSEASVLALAQVLQSPHTPIPLQISVIQALVWLETSDSLKYLQQSLLSLNIDGIMTMIGLLGRLETETLKTQGGLMLLDFAQSGHQALKNNQVKQILAHTLGLLGVKQAIPRLHQLAQDQDSGVRLHAIAALKQLNS